MAAEPSKEAEKVCHSGELVVDDEDLKEVIDYALGRSTKGTTYMGAFIGSILESYGKKLGLVGRVLSNVGDSLAGLGRWMQMKDGKRGDVRDAMAHQAQAMKLSKDDASVEERLALNLLCAAFQEVVSDTHIPDDKLEEHLVERLREISDRLLILDESESCDKQEEAALKNISDLVMSKVVFVTKNA